MHVNEYQINRGDENSQNSLELTPVELQNWECVCYEIVI